MTASPLTLARALPPPRSLPSLGPRSGHPPVHWAPAPAPAARTSSLSGTSGQEQTSAARGSASPAPSASSSASRPPLVGPDRTCGDSGGWAGPAWAVRFYPGALPPSAPPSPQMYEDRGGSHAPSTQGPAWGTEPPRARSHARPQPGEALAAARDAWWAQPLTLAWWR